MRQIKKASFIIFLAIASVSQMYSSDLFLFNSPEFPLKHQSINKKQKIIKHLAYIQNENKIKEETNHSAVIQEMLILQRRNHKLEEMIRDISSLLSCRRDNVQFLHFLIQAHALTVIMQHRRFLNCFYDKQKEHPEGIAHLQKILDSLPSPVYKTILFYVPELQKAFPPRNMEYIEAFDLNKYVIFSNNIDEFLQQFETQKNCLIQQGRPIFHLLDSTLFLFPDCDKIDKKSKALLTKRAIHYMKKEIDSKLEELRSW